MLVLVACISMVTILALWNKSQADIRKPHQIKLKFKSLHDRGGALTWSGVHSCGYFFHQGCYVFACLLFSRLCKTAIWISTNTREDGDEAIEELITFWSRSRITKLETLAEVYTLNSTHGNNWHSCSSSKQCLVKTAHMIRNVKPNKIISR